MCPFLWIDVAGSTLNPEDKEILSHPSVGGVVLFTKNFESVPQLKALTQSILSVSNQLIITVDQEGGRVQRFLDGFTKLPSMSEWGYVFAASQKSIAENIAGNEIHALTIDSFEQTMKQMVTELQYVGVYANLAPVLDVDCGRSQIIGERSFGDNPDDVIALAERYIDRVHALNMPVVGKHFPGHGWVVADSHKVLPVDSRAPDVIFSQDMAPFAKLASKLDAIMPAHIVYEQCDDFPAGFSRYWLQTVLRDQLCFDGLIITDDLSMEGAAAFGDYVSRAELALDAGADILTICNNRSGVIEVLDKINNHSNEQLAKRLSFYTRFREHSR